MELREVFEPVFSFVKTFQKKDKEVASKQAAKDRLKLVLMQDRASVSPDFFDMMKKELIDVIKKYIEIDEETLEVELTRGMEVGLEGPALYANIPIKNVKPVAPQGTEEDDSQAIDEITEEKVDAAAEEILNQIEEIAKKNKEELVQEKVETVDSSVIEDIPEPMIGESVESVEEEVSKPVEEVVAEVTSLEETEVVEPKAEMIEPESEIEEEPKVKRKTTRRTTTKKKKEA